MLFIKPTTYKIQEPNQSKSQNGSAGRNCSVYGFHSNAAGNHLVSLLALCIGWWSVQNDRAERMDALDNGRV